MTALPNQLNRQFLLAARPTGFPDEHVWRRVETPIADPGEGELLVRVLYLAIDPAMRMWMNEGRSYIEPVEIGSVMRAIGVGRVIASRDGRFAEGDYVSGLLGVQDYSVIAADDAAPVDESLAPLPVHLGALGLPGMSAYFGLLDIGRPRPGETVVVSAAAGAVGATVGQIAKIAGCRVVGIAGGERKRRLLLDELGFDAAIDYKAQDVAGALAQACPDRVDVYFDNVGGEILDAVLTQLARGARIILSGAVSQYNATAPRGPANYLALAVDRARMEGFIVTDYAGRFEQAAGAIAGWIAEGRLRTQEEVLVGLDRFPEGLAALFAGEHRGKLILEVAAP